MILDACDDVFVFIEQLGIVVPVVEGIDEMKFRLREMKNICQADDLFKVVAEKACLCYKDDGWNGHSRK